MAKWLGRAQLELPVEKARITHKITSLGGDDDFVRVIVGKVGNKKLAAPISSGAGSITSLVKADGLVIIPRGVQGLENGDEVDVHLYRKLLDIERTIFCIGSHDMSLDILAQSLAGKNRRLASSNVGSLGGIISLQRGDAHIAGSHLLDPKTGEYNLKYIHQYLNDLPVNVYGFVGRKQGLIINKGNPKGIHGLQDLENPGVHFINRQRGAGTRVLLEYHLNKLGMEPTAINGFEQEEYTHLGVAAAVASERADCGLGISGAAQALNLDFIPLFNETYQLIIPKEFVNSVLLTPLFEVINSTQFQEAVAAMPGYDVSEMGKLVAEV
jgi:putative molybdopterin biosynthesis protein